MLSMEFPARYVYAKQGMSKLARRLITFRQTFIEGEHSEAELLTTDEVISGLIAIVTETMPNNRRLPRDEALKREALFSVRTLIGGLIRGGLPAKNAYDFFTMADLNLLFHIHSELVGANEYPEIPFGNLFGGSEA